MRSVELSLKGELALASTVKTVFDKRGFSPFNDPTAMPC